MPAPIAAAGQALRSYLDRNLAKDLPGLKVTMLPPDKARLNSAGRQVNLYLFDIREDAARKNIGLGSSRVPRRGLELHYVVTAYDDEEGQSDADNHVVLNAVLDALNGAARLSLGRSAADGFATLAWMPMAMDDLLRLWTAFQTPYRLSVIYELSLFATEVDP